MRNVFLAALSTLGIAVCLVVGFQWPTDVDQTVILPGLKTGDTGDTKGLKTGKTEFSAPEKLVASSHSPKKSLFQTKAIEFQSLSRPATAMPNPDPNTQSVKNDSGNAGALLLCGGGKLPDEIFHRFYELGGADQGTLVIIPTASPRSDFVELSEYLKNWSKFAWKQVCILHAESRDEAQSQEFGNALNAATAVWISGGDQNRLTSRYRGTPVESKLSELMRRGGVIGGTSAGTAVTSKVMIAGGYRYPILSEGFNLLPGAIVDQHFSQRRRYQRLQTALQRYPQCVGYGIDEGTGLLIGGQRAEVIGRGQVFVYNAPKIPRSDVVQVSYETNTLQAFSAGSIIPLDFSANGSLGVTPMASLEATITE